MPTVGLASAALAAVSLETFVYGVYVVVFSLYVRILFLARHRSNPKHSAFSAPVTLFNFFFFLCITARWLIDLVRQFEAFAYGSESPTTYYSHFDEPKHVASEILYVIEATIGDSVLTYRLFHIYSRSWKACMFPILTTLLVFVSGIGTVAIFVAKPGVNIYEPVCSRWIITAYMSSVVTNVYDSTLIGWRMLGASDSRFLQDKRYGTGVSASHVIALIIESAAIYTICTLFTVAAFLAHSDLVLTGQSITSPAIGIAFVLIIVRVKSCEVGGDEGKVLSHPGFGDGGYTRNVHKGSVALVTQPEEPAEGDSGKVVCGTLDPEVGGIKNGLPVNDADRDVM